MDSDVLCLNVFEWLLCFLTGCMLGHTLNFMKAHRSIPLAAELILPWSELQSPPPEKKVVWCQAANPLGEYEYSHMLGANEATPFTPKCKPWNITATASSKLYDSHSLSQIYSCCTCNQSALLNLYVWGEKVNVNRWVNFRIRSPSHHYLGTLSKKTTVPPPKHLKPSAKPCLALQRTTPQLCTCSRDK